MSNDVIYVPNCDCRGFEASRSWSPNSLLASCPHCATEPVAYVPQETYAQAERAYYKLLSECDRLRAENERLREALESIMTYECYRRVGGPDNEDLLGLDHGVQKAVEIAANALKETGND